MADKRERHEPTDAQLDAAAEGARDMVESKRSALSTNQNPVDQRGGGGGIQGAGGTAQGGSNSAAGTDHSTDPSAETGGPRGAGTSISRTSGGLIKDSDDPRGVEPDEFIKRETAVFLPGSGGRKPDEER
jgi:hypothetical protein